MSTPVLVMRPMQRFRPMSLEKPKVLLPLVGVPMINYTLEWLASNKMAKASSVVDLCAFPTRCYCSLHIFEAARTAWRRLNCAATQPTICMKVLSCVRPDSDKVAVLTRRCTSSAALMQSR